MLTDPNQAAFPELDDVEYESGHVLELRQHGLTKREYFAALLYAAMADKIDQWEATISEYARCAVIAADRLIDALNLPKESLHADDQEGKS